MKNLKSLLSAVALLFICVAANATISPSKDKPTKADIINVYTDAISKGKTATLADMLSDDMQFNLHRGENVTAINKNQFLDNMKNVTPDAPTSTTSSVVQEDDNTYIVKINFKYADYTRTDVVTLQNSNGWSVTNIDSSTK